MTEELNANIQQIRAKVENIRKLLGPKSVEPPAVNPAGEPPPDGTPGPEEITVEAPPEEYRPGNPESTAALPTWEELREYRAKLHVVLPDRPKVPAQPDGWSAKHVDVAAPTEEYRPGNPESTADLPTWEELREYRAKLDVVLPDQPKVPAYAEGYAAGFPAGFDAGFKTALKIDAVLKPAKGCCGRHKH